MPANSKLRILILTRNLPPLVGGMERLNWHMADELSKQAEVRAIGPKGSATKTPPSVTLTEAPLKPLVLFMLVTLIKGLWISLLWRPNVVLAGSGLVAPLAWVMGRLCGARTAGYLHGFDITVNHRIYRALWRPTFKKLDSVIVNSTPTRALALHTSVKESNVSVVFPGVSLPSYPRSEKHITMFKERHGLFGKKILLSVGRLTTRKGLREFVASSLPAIVRAMPDVVLVIVGEAPKNSLGAGVQTVESILSQAAEVGVLENIKFLGVITDQDLLATAYGAADVHVFPVRHIPDDPEGFGMVAIEAAAHGLPTVAFATGGIIDAVRHGESGYLAENRNYAELSHYVLEVIRQPIPTDRIRKFAAGFAWEQFGDSVLNAIRESKNCD